MLAVTVDAPGGVENLRYTEQPTPVAAAGELLIRVRATSVNRADILQRRGLYAPPPGVTSILGLELAGEIAALGDGVTTYAIGDRVCAITAGGGNAQFATIPAGCAMRIPDGMTFEEAAAFSEVWITAYDNLFNWGRLAEGERALIHGGGSGIGTAAIQLAKWRKAEAIVTVGSDDKGARCVELGATRFVNYKTGNWADHVADIDVILDIIGAQYFEANVRVLRLGGRLVVIGLQGGIQASLDLMQLLHRRLSIMGTTLRARSVDEKSRLSQRVAMHLFPAFVRGELRVLVDRVLPIAQIAEAHRAAEASEHFGKIVLRVD